MRHSKTYKVVKDKIVLYKCVFEVQYSGSSSMTAHQPLAGLCTRFYLADSLRLQCFFS